MLYGVRSHGSFLVTVGPRVLRIGNSDMRNIAIGFATLILLASAALTQDEMAVLNFIVIRDYSGKPIRNASVVMHPVEKNGKQSRGGLQIKTDPDGKASFDGVPYGKLRVQVLATGFQTFGEDYSIDRPAMAITVRMKRPQGQYSIYEDHPEDKKADPEPPKPPDKDSKDKPQ
jgi:Carboxypeptidase regulatory-like domain